MTMYLVRFIRMDGGPDEEYYYRTAELARHHFSLFREDDSGLYTRIELICREEAADHWIGCLCPAGIGATA